MRYFTSNFPTALFAGLTGKANYRCIACAICSIVLLLAYPAAVHAGKFPHKTASYTIATTMPMNMGSIEGTHYVSYDGKKSVSAEWTTQTMMMQGTRRSLNLVRDGVVHNVDLDKKTCTKTDISSLHDRVEDPEQLGEQLKKSMNLERAGTCEGAGLKGVLFKSGLGSFCLYKDVFMLWSESMGSRTEVSNVVFDKRLPKDKISLPKGINCVAGPSLDDITTMRERMGEAASGSAAPAGTDENNERKHKPHEQAEDEQPDEPPMSEEQVNKQVQEATEAAKKLLEGFGGFLKK